MGIFDFIKDVGEKLGITSSDESPSAEALKKEVESHGLDAKDLDVKVEGDTVKISGTAASTSIREKLILAAGNVLGIGKVEEDIKVETKEPDASFYTVAKGDTLWKIAETQYGKGKGPKYTVIFEANKPMLKHPDKIYPGQKLRIPPLS
ncbi:MAG: peptidoglycan-binding protein LysM [Rhodobiaceae bacterium]|nr:peptidoglycan-binding protein LysM [Rhodobiaceae bacterium]MCC0056340.1 peptidoglycan-binding protein LysM [Rhodobiaceae bacterium]